MFIGFFIARSSSNFFLRSSSVTDSSFCLNFSSHSLYSRREPAGLGPQLELLYPLDAPSIPGYSIARRFGLLLICFSRISLSFYSCFFSFCSCSLCLICSRLTSCSALFLSSCCNCSSKRRSSISFSYYSIIFFIFSSLYLRSILSLRTSLCASSSSAEF